MKKIIYLFILITALSLFSCSQDNEKSNQKKQNSTSVSRDLFAMDTYMNLTAYGENAQTALGKSAEKIIFLEEILSVTNQNSDIYKLNNSNGNEVKVNEDTANIINTSCQISDMTNGALDITLYPVIKEWGFTTEKYKIPEKTKLDELLLNVNYKNISVNGLSVTIPQKYQLDTGALTKGYTGDKVAEILKNHDIQSALINLGGNIHTVGSKPDGSLWRVGIKNPFDTNEQLCILSIEDKAVITSGNYERYFEGDDGKKYWHIIDPKDGFPADNGLVSVTIIGDSGIMCDALSTALFVMGKEKAVAYHKESNDFDMILVSDDRKIYITNGIENNFENVSNMEVILLN